jgi:GNAT superfamily N-acetyltransferase
MLSGVDPPAAPSRARRLGAALAGLSRFLEGNREATATNWARLHDPAEPMHVLGAFCAGELVGIVHYVFHRSTWTVGGHCYLQDLFTIEAVRGQGVGRALIESVYDRAQAAGTSGVHWLSHESNETARALYEKVAERSGFIQYRKLF